MTRKIIAVLLCLGGTVLAAAPALAGLQLGERPITRAEVIAAVKKQFAEMDTNHDGFISRSEFEAYHAAEEKMPDGNRGLTHIGRGWFDRSDTNGDGRISPSEAQARALELFDMADANHDGVASIEEQRLAQLFVK
jgi:hypothetical protein